LKLILDLTKIQPVKMINLLLQNNINLLLLLRYETYTVSVDVLIVEYPGNQFISIHAGQSIYSFRHILIREMNITYKFE